MHKKSAVEKWCGTCKKIHFAISAFHVAVFFALDVNSLTHLSSLFFFKHINVGIQTWHGTALICFSVYLHHSDTIHQALIAPYDMNQNTLWPSLSWTYTVWHTVNLYKEKSRNAKAKGRKEEKECECKQTWMRHCLLQALQKVILPAFNVFFRQIHTLCFDGKHRIETSSIPLQEFKLYYLKCSNLIFQIEQIKLNNIMYACLQRNA